MANIDLVLFFGGLLGLLPPPSTSSSFTFCFQSNAIGRPQLSRFSGPLLLRPKLPPLFSKAEVQTTAHDETNEKKEEEEFDDDYLWRKGVLVDYSAINEYYAAHYGHTGNHQPYFETETVDDKCFVNVYNARRGVIIHDGTNKEESKSVKSEDSKRHFRFWPMLERDGFTLAQTLSAKPSSSPELISMDEICEIYLPELRQILSSELDGDIETVVFWHPMMRSDAFAPSSSNSASRGDDIKIKRASVAGMVHIDTDVGAHTAQEIASLVHNNRITEFDKHDDSHSASIQSLARSIENGQRFVILNAWRNIDPYHRPITRFPLAVQPAIYNSAAATPYASASVFPDAKMDQNQSPWYVFPKMLTNEVLLFKQYDRLADRPSDLWHVALPIVDNDDSSASAHRTSLVIRAFVLFRDGTTTTTTADQDRFHARRTRPQLSFEESEAFCHEQSIRRKAAASDRHNGVE